MNYVTDVVDYVLGLLGPRRPRPAPHALLPHRARSHAAKRDRSDTEVVTLQPDESSEEDDTAPALKRRRRPSPPPFPRLNMSRADNTDYRNDSTSKVRYVPIQVEDGHPSTSTPIDTSGRQVTRLKTYPASKRIGATEIRRLDPALKRVSTPVRKVVHTIIDDDDAEVSWIEPKSHSYGQNSRSSPELYVRLDDEEEEEVEEVQDENDIVYVRRVEPSVYTKKNQFFVSRNNNKDTERVSSPRQYYKIHGKFPPRRPVSPRMQNKFKAPAGVTKSYRQKNFTEIPKWLYPLKTSGNNRFPMKSRFSLLNGNAKTAIEEAFNLEEKLKYQALIQKSTGKWKPTQTQKEFETIDLDDDSVAKANKSSRKERYQDKEYDPITIASLTSSDSEVEIVGSSEASTSSSVRISPVNTFRDKLKEYPVTSCDFLDNLDKRHLIKRNKMQQELQDKKKASDFLGEQNRRHNLELLERSFQTDLTITQSLLEESSSAVELPKLTAEQEKLVNRALGAGPSGQLLIEKFNLRIHRRDLQTLAGLNWLNDEVINFYMNLLMQRSEERNDLPKVYAANTFFYPKLMQSGQAGLRRWTRKVDIFAHDLIVIPVHLGVHWCLCLVEMDMKRIAYLDSMGGRNPQCLDAVLQYLCDEHKDKKGKQFDDSGWKKECLKDIPQQMNGSDCGMFACTFAEFSCRRAPYTFTQSDMPYLRRKLAYEILQGQLML